MLTMTIAEFRGPGVHHRQDDSGDDYDMNMDSRAGGRVILLGNGGELHEEADDQDTDMFDQSDEEEKDLESQVRKGQAQASDRTKREETPGPEASDEGKSNQHKSETAAGSTGSVSTPDEPKMTAATDGPAKSS